MEGRYHMTIITRKELLLRIFGPAGKHMLSLDSEGPWVFFDSVCWVCGDESKVLCSAVSLRGGLECSKCEYMTVYPCDMQ